MGKSGFSSGTQVKERARQQKQIDKASKRMLARQKKAFVKTSPPVADSETSDSITAHDIVENIDSPARPSTKS
jgi:hypothetical protein